MIKYGLRVRRKCIYSCNMYENKNKIEKKNETNRQKEKLNDKEKIQI